MSIGRRITVFRAILLAPAARENGQRRAAPRLFIYGSFVSPVAGGSLTGEADGRLIKGPLAVAISDLVPCLAPRVIAVGCPSMTAVRLHCGEGRAAGGN